MVRNSSLATQFLSNIFWLDMKEAKADVKATKAMVKDIVDKMSACDCSYPLDLVTILYRSLHMVIGEEVLEKLKRWLTPPDPSTNYTIGLRKLHKETATWFSEGRIFQEWHSTGSLLWIHGKRTFL